MESNLISHNPNTVLQRPWRAPIEIPEVLAPYYKGKKVVEIGFALGDFMPTWSKYASKVVGYEADASRYDPAIQREDLKKLNNIVMLQQLATPEGIADADFYYTWTLGELGGPDCFRFIEDMRAAGKKGVFAFYAGWAERDLTEHLYGGSMCYSKENLDESKDKVVYFNSKELDNRSEFDSLSKTNEYTIIVKNL